MLDKWLIMFAGIGTVFVALIGLIAMLALFKVIFGARPEKKRAAMAPLPEINSPIPSAATSTGVATSSGIDAGLVAAIVAAVSAASGQSPNDFRIAAITPCNSEVGFNTPIWGRVERFLRG